MPPPITTRPRDFRLTAADAARIRPAGWRRLVGTFAGFQALATRPVGVGLATLGLVGLLVGNAPALPIGGAASAPMAAQGAPNAASGAEDAAGGRSSVGGGPEAVSVPAASAAASARAGFGTDDTGASSSSAPGASDQLAAEPAPAASGAVGGSSPGNGTVKTASTPVPTATDATREPESSDSSPFRPLNLLFGAAVLVGLGVLVASRFRSRSAV